MQQPGPTPPPDQSEKSVGELVFDVSERTSTLIREEIELAKAEISEKVSQLIRGSVVGVVGRRLPLLRADLIMEGVAWLLNDLVFDNFWLGFFVEAALFILIGGGWRSWSRCGPSRGGRRRPRTRRSRRRS